MPWILLGLLGALLIGISVPRILDSSLFGGGSSQAARRPDLGFSPSRARFGTTALPAGVSRLCRKGLSYTQCHPTAGRFNPDDTKISDCGRDFICYEQAFGNVSYYKGPKAALALFDKLMKTNRYVAADCHRTAHVMGAAALARYHGNVAEAFARGSASCWSGYYHGILERALIDAPRRGIGAVARSLCAGRDVRRTVWLAYQCVHGLGHGLMILSGYNLPFALKTCDQLATEWDRSSCTGGVFMENIVSSYGLRSPWLKTSDPVYPCNAIKDRYRPYCYSMVTSWINHLNRFDWRKTVETCRGVERKYVVRCFESIGRDASGQTVENPRKVLAVCSLDRRYWINCMYGAARDFTAVFANGRRAAQLCALITYPDLQGTCFWNIGTTLGTMSATKAGREAACKAITKTYLGSCIAGTDAVRYVEQQAKT